MIDKQKQELLSLVKQCQNKEKNTFNSINQDFLVRNFLNVQEKIIQKNYYNKNNYDITFYLSKKYLNTWDITFLGQYIFNQLDEDAKNKIDKLTKNNLYIIKKSLTEITQIEKTTSYKLLSQSIITIDLLYSYLKDNLNIIESKQTLEATILNNKCTIKLEYLGEYGSGIIPFPEDKKLAEETDKQVISLFINLNLDYKEIPNFYYRTHIDRINFLTELVNFDQNKFNLLPASCFTSVVPVSWIKKLLKLVNNDIDSLINLPETIFIEQPYIEYLKELLNLVDNDINYFQKLPVKIFDRETTIERVNYIINRTNKKSISELKNIPNKLFICSEKRLNFFAMKTKNNLTLLKNIHPFSFSSKTTEERLQLLINLVNEDYKLLTNINPLLYTSSNKRVRFILQLTNNDVKSLSSIPDSWFNEKTTSEERITYIHNLLSQNIYYSSSLNEIIYYDKFTTEQRINLLYELSNKKINKFKSIPPIAFSNTVKENTILDLYELTNHNIEEFQYIPELIYKEEINIKDYRDILRVLTEKERLNYQDYKLIYRFIKENNYDKKSIYERLNHLLKEIPHQEDIYNLPDYAFRKTTNNTRISFLINLLEYDLDKCALIPKEFFLKDINVTRIVSLYNLVNKDLIELSNLPKEIYLYPKVSINSIYNLHKQNKAKPLFGLGDRTIVANIIFMLSVYNDYTNDMINKNQLLKPFEITNPDSIMTEYSNELKDSLINLNNVIEQLPRIVKNSDNKDINKTIELSLRKINNSADKINIILEKQNSKIINYIKNSILNLRIHIKNNTIILEDYTIDENAFRNHTFKMEGTINDFIELTKSLIDNSIQNSTKVFVEELYNRINIDTRKKYGKRLINTILNKVEEYKKDTTKVLYVKEKLEQLGIQDITFIFEQDGINIKYKENKKYNYSEINDLIKKLDNI